MALGSLQRSERSKQVLVNQHTPVLPASPFLYPIFPHFQLQMQARSSLQKGESRESVPALQAGSNIQDGFQGVPLSLPQRSRLPEPICNCLHEF